MKNIFIRDQEDIDNWKIASFVLIVIAFLLVAASVYNDSKYLRTHIGKIDKEVYDFTSKLREDFKYVFIINIKTNQSMELINNDIK